MRIYLSGTGSIKPEIFDTVVQKYHPYVLESFFYMNNNVVSNLNNFEDFLLDSGAFTFIHNPKNRNFIEYQDKYCEFINKYDIKHFFELDIDNVIGYEEVKKLRQDLEQKTGKKCIPVFHVERGLEEYKNLCKNYDYIAIGTIHQYNKNPQILRQLVEIAKSYGTKVHGLGYTRLEKKRSIDFYSVDSTTWINCSRYGELHKFDGSTIKKIKFKNKRLVPTDEVIKNNFEEWCKYQFFLDK